MIKYILIVCVGNICRSPIVEHMLKKNLPDLKIESAGLCACIGSRADPMAMRVSQNHGLSLQYHFAKQLSFELMRSVDLILVMEDEHLKKINALMPEAKGKTMLLGHWNGKKQIPDPYGKNIDEFERIFSLIQDSVRGWGILQGCNNRDDRKKRKNHRP